ncbi:IS3 family transposase, partial [Burkholderia pseudomallei]|uniref:IS3 family transposase n=1 Tax=Burkholderia pseudomallei TaxID=28450 RepID=UPI0021804760
VGLSRSVLHYDAKPDHENEVLAARLVKLAHERRRFGYRRLHALVEREGTHANHKRIYRLYREAGLAVRRRRKRHGVMIEREQLALPGAPDLPDFFGPFQSWRTASVASVEQYRCLNSS